MKVTPVTGAPALRYRPSWGAGRSLVRWVMPTVGRAPWVPSGLATVVVFLVFTLLNGGFVARVNLEAMIQQMAQVAVTGLGMTAAIAMGAFDLSVGSIAGLTAIVVASALSNGFGVAAAVALAVAVGGTCGLINGVLVGYGRIPAFVVTLGTLSVFLGISLLYTQGASILIANSQFAFLGKSGLAWFPLTGVLTLCLWATWFLLMRYTRFGRSVLAIGANRNAAAALGIHVRRVICGVFILVGFSAAISGIFEAATLLNVSPDLGQDNFNLLAIAVVVIGGTSLKGGRASLGGSVFATVLVVAIDAGLNVLGVSSLVDDLVVGLVLITALLAAATRDRYLTRQLTTRRVPVLQ